MLRQGKELGMLMIIGTLTIKPEMIDQIRTVLRDVRSATLKESGNISYDGHISLNDPTKLVFIERWKSREAFDRHLTEPHIKVWREAAANFVIDRSIQLVHVDRVEQL
jgi:quinol monooxygenase YgiN